MSASPALAATRVPAEVATARWALPAGLRLAAQDPRHACADRLHPQERALVPHGDLGRRQQFVAGRVCARTALRSLGAPDAPVLTAADGSPRWPAGLTGSITHKPGLALAVAARIADFGAVGVDVEPARRLPDVVLPRVLTGRELARVRRGDTAYGLVEPRLVFSAKEAYYKLYRSLGGAARIDFGDVEVELSTGAVRVRPCEPDRFPAVEGRWVVGRRWLLTVLWSPG